MPPIEGSPEEREDVVVGRTDPTPPPVEEEIDDATVRKVLKARFGEDDPEAFKTRLARAKEVEDLLPEYQRTVSGLIEQINARPAPQPDRPSNLRSPEEQEEHIKELFHRDPWKALDLMRKQDKVQMAKMAAMAEERGYERARGALDAKDYGSRLRTEWPEAYDPKHELYQVAGSIYRDEMDEGERKRPNSIYVAAERAAGRLGIAPRSRRTAAPPVQQERDLDSLAGQSVARSAPKPKDSSGDVELTVQDRKRIAAMGLDEKTYKLAKANRKAGKNIRVEDK